MSIRKWSVMSFFILMYSVPSIHSQDAATLLDAVIAGFSKVNNYQADVQITTDIPFIKMMPMKAKLYFRQPDQLRVVSKGIAILPRQGFDQMYAMLLRKDLYTLVPQGNETTDGISAAVISILPNSDTMEVILGKFWIDTRRNVIIRSQITTRTNGTISANYVYGSQAAFGLPDKMTFVVDVKKFKIPKAVAADLNNQTRSTDNSKEPKKGKIEILLTNYLVNKGVPDRIFEK